MSATNLLEIEVLVMVDSDGNYEFGHDGDDLKTRWEENIGDLDPANATRVIRVKLKVPTPQVVELEAEIPEEPSDAELKVA